MNLVGEMHSCFWGRNEVELLEPSNVRSARVPRKGRREWSRCGFVHVLIYGDGVVT